MEVCIILLGVHTAASGVSRPIDHDTDTRTKGNYATRPLPLGATPPLGWTTWCTGGACGQPGWTDDDAPGRVDLHDVCNEYEVKSIAAAMNSTGMRSAGYTLILLDDCWGAVERAPDGQLAADRSRFPSGNGTMQELADWLHARGFYLGLYATAGNETCSTGTRTIPGEPNARGVPGSCSAGPPTAASCKQQYARDAETLARWGTDFVKLDWCNFNTTSADPPVSQPDLTMAFGDALAEHATEAHPIFFNFHCGAPYASWCSTAMATETEIKSRRASTSMLSSTNKHDRSPTAPNAPPTVAVAARSRSWRIGKDHHDLWYSTSPIIDVLGTTANRSAPHAFVDADFLMTGGAGCDARAPNAGLRCPGMTETEYRTEFSLWCIGASQILIATDLREMSTFMHDTLLHDGMIAISQDPLVKSHGVVQSAPCTLDDTAYNDEDQDLKIDFDVDADATQTKTSTSPPPPLPPPTCQVWARELVGGNLAVALYNGGNVSSTMTIIPYNLLYGKEPTLSNVPRPSVPVNTLDSMPCNGKGQCMAHVRDVWGRRDIGMFTPNQRYDAVVESHETIVLLINRTVAKPP